MWRVAGRMMGVFLIWGVVLGLSVATGIPSHAAEALSTCGAGVSLMLWGIAVSREQHRIRVVLSDETPAEQGREAM